jgi:hypothetical protein
MSAPDLRLPSDPKDLPCVRWGVHRCRATTAITEELGLSRKRVDRWIRLEALPARNGSCSISVQNRLLRRCYASTKQIDTRAPVHCPPGRLLLFRHRQGVSCVWPDVASTELARAEG